MFINLNPFMRFDGYYVFSELIGVENLQLRAFELGRWHMREILFGLGASKPESWAPGMTVLLICYAYATWIYRLILFVGIALVVYHVFFKVLGILMFLVEIGMFIARPVMREIGLWIKMRKEIMASKRIYITAAAVFGLLALAVVPWSTRVAVPAIVEAASWQSVHAPQPARVAAVHVVHGQQVRAGDPLVTLASTELDHKLRLALTQLEIVRVRLARRGADGADREQSMVLESQRQSLAGQIEGIEAEKEKLVVRAPISGSVLELCPDLTVGRWFGPSQMLALIGDRSAAQVRGYVSESDIGRLAIGTPGVFVPDSIQRRTLSVSVAGIAADSAASISVPELTSIGHGPIAVTAGPSRELVPVTGHYLVHLSVDEAGAPEVALRGTAILSGEPESILAGVWRQTLKVLLREAGA